MPVTAKSVDAIDEKILSALARSDQPGGPPKLAAAMKDAVLPGGARIRPRLMLAVAAACGAQKEDLALSAAVSLELMHCASLVHDDLPTFDDASVRRGKPTTHKKFGEPIAVLTGDALIMLAFEELAVGAAEDHHILPSLTKTLAGCIGMPFGLCAGQAWEEEPEPDINAYHAAKTGALFAGVTVMGALVAEYPSASSWSSFGMELGSAYQMADDICDVTSTEGTRGKPCGQDERFGRPNIANTMGVKGAVETLMQQIDTAVGHIPECPGRESLEVLVRATTRNFLPDNIWALSA